MKQFISKILLSLTIISCINLNIYAENNIPAIQEAIQNSRLDLLEKALDKTNLTEEDQKSLIDFAEQIAKQRETKMNLAFLTNKEKKDTRGDELLVAILTLGTGIISTIKIISDLVNNKFDEDSSTFLFGAPLSFALCWACINSTLNKDKQFRTLKQKWIDSLKIQQILNKKNREN